MKRKIFSGLLVLAIVLSAMSYGFSENKVQAADKYWICGSSYGEYTVGGNMKLYMKKNSVVIKGHALISKSKNQFYNMKGKKVKYSKKTLKLAKNCKVVECEGGEEYKYAYAAYCRDRGIKPSQKCPFISAGVVIQNGKVIAIYFSA